MRKIALSFLTACSVMIGDPESGPGDGGGGGSGGGNTDEPNPDPIFAEQHPRVYMDRNAERLRAALTASQASAVRFSDMVDRWMNGSDIWGFQIHYAALLGYLTNDASYCERAVSEIDTYVAAEEALITSGQRPTLALDSYLEVGPHVADITLTYDWCAGFVSAAQRDRWLALADQAVWNVWNYQEATWGGVAYPWSGWSINNPSNNYYYSFLRATMLLGLVAHGEHPRAQEWLTFFRDEKIGAELVPTFEADLIGGGSREGTGYGTAMAKLFELYDLWEGSTGESLARLTDHTRASMLYMMHAIVPTRDRVAPIGDHARDSTAALFDYHRNYLQVLAYTFRNDPIAARAKWLLENSSVPQMAQQFNFVYDFLYEQPNMTEMPVDDLGLGYYAEGAGTVFVRSSWDTDATWLNVIAGPYTESHAHQDQGSLMVYKGEWLAYDPNIDSSSGLVQGTDAHNLVRIAGATMSSPSAGKVTRLVEGDGYFVVGADVTGAYGDGGAVSKSEREVVYLMPDVIVVYDRMDTTAAQTWQLASPMAPTISGARASISGAHHQLTIDRILPAATGNVVALPSTNGDFHGGYRLEWAAGSGAQTHLNVLSIDGAAAQITPMHAGDLEGVAIVLADGRTASVQFSRSGGATIVNLAGTQATVSETVAELSEQVRQPAPQ